MASIVDWLVGIGLTIPGASWFSSVVAAVIVLMVIDAAIGLLITGVYTLLGGGRR